MTYKYQITGHSENLEYYEVAKKLVEHKMEALNPDYTTAAR